MAVKALFVYVYEFLVVAQLSCVVLIVRVLRSPIAEHLLLSINYCL
jgi:hypothetical protein